MHCPLPLNDIFQFANKLKESWYQTYKPKDELKCIKHKKILYPLTYQNVKLDAKTFTTFICGEGHVTSKQLILVPLFNEDTACVESICKYVEDYGEFCLFYSLFGKLLGDDDCSYWGIRQEFMVALNKGVESLKYNSEAVQKVNAINEKIHNIYTSQFTFNGETIEKDGEYVCFKDKLFYVKLCFSINAYFLTKPHVDVISDDEKIFKYYSKVSASTKLDNFPTSMKERMELIYGKEITTDYQYILKNFPITI